MISKFLTIDTSILSLYVPKVLQITPPDSAILKCTSVQFKFMERYMPSENNIPVFEVAIIEGDDRDRSTWKYLHQWKHCFINLLSKPAIEQWNREHSFSLLSRDEPVSYTLPIKLLI